MMGYQQISEMRMEPNNQNAKMKKKKTSSRATNGSTSVTPAVTMVTNIVSQVPAVCGHAHHSPCVTCSISVCDCFPSLCSALSTLFHKPLFISLSC